jgi:hypothetical protein
MFDNANRMDSERLKSYFNTLRTVLTTEGIYQDMLAQGEIRNSPDVVTDEVMTAIDLMINGEYKKAADILWGMGFPNTDPQTNWLSLTLQDIYQRP